MTGTPRERLDAVIGRQGSMLISFSGGVDSGLLAAMAHRRLGRNVSCILLDSPVVPRRAIREALRIAEELGLPCSVVPFPVLGNEEFRKNPADRCYFCKKMSAATLKEEARKRGCECIIDGVNLSDYGQHRPGIRACEEEGIQHPFIEAGMSKPEIRVLARECGLPFWNKPSAACLSSRIPYGEEITEEKLRRIEEAEDLLMDKGFGQVRVRCQGDLARIEVDRAEMPRLFEQRDEITRDLKALGFVYVTLDLEGFRSGSMDEVL
jgi:uncharacterized protein